MKSAEVERQHCALIQDASHLVPLVARVLLRNKGSRYENATVLGLPSTIPGYKLTPQPMIYQRSANSSTYCVYMYTFIGVLVK